MQRWVNAVKALFHRTRKRSDSQPVRLPRSQHGLSRKQIDKAALDVLYTLRRAGFDACLVGGGVRDLLLGLEPKDFDVATDARPEEIKKVFGRKCRIIGRRFRLAHVHFGRRKIIEVATFRGQHGEGQRKTDTDGRILFDNVYGTMEEDAWRRDFTVNALYYDIGDFSIIDYTGGIEDLRRGVLRLIGDPAVRYREDPVRTIRAVRFAVKLGFRIDPDTERPLAEMGRLLRDVAPARLFEETLKLFHNRQAVEVFEKLRHYDLFRHLFPQVDTLLDEDLTTRQLVIAGLKSTEKRLQENKGVNPAFLFAFMLWGPLIRRMQQLLAEGMPPQQAMSLASNDILLAQLKHTAIPRRFTQQIRDIWFLQLRLPNRYGERAASLFAHDRFRAAYDLLGLRAEAGEKEIQPLYDWWTQYQTLSPVDRVNFALSVSRPKRRRKRRRRNRNPYRKRAQTADSASTTPNGAKPDASSPSDSP